MSIQGDSGDDILAITPTKPVKVAAALCVLGGVLNLVLALQAGAFLEAAGIYRLSEPVFAILGLLSIFLGYRVSRMRGRAAILATVVSGVTCLCALAWFAIALYHGVFILLGLALMPISSIASIASLASIQPTRRADEARSRLRAQGLDVGL